MTRPNVYALIGFVTALHDLIIGSPYGPSNAEQDRRVARWMDAVLPPTPEISDKDFPEELTKAAE
jgi:hypothetical protein